MDGGQTGVYTPYALYELWPRYGDSHSLSETAQRVLGGITKRYFLDMAGGKLAEYVPCMVCLTDAGQLTKANRIHEGDESDQYKCEKGHKFGMDWSTGPATEAQWPPSTELQALAKD